MISKMFYLLFLITVFKAPAYLFATAHTKVSRFLVTVRASGLSWGPSFFNDKSETQSRSHLQSFSVCSGNKRKVHLWLLYILTTVSQPQLDSPVAKIKAFAVQRLQRRAWITLRIQGQRSTHIWIVISAPWLSVDESLFETSFYLCLMISGVYHCEERLYTRAKTYENKSKIKLN